MPRCLEFRALAVKDLVLKFAGFEVTSLGFMSAKILNFDNYWYRVKGLGLRVEG